MDPAHSDSETWHYADENNQPIGPFTLNELNQLHSAGTISAQTLVFRSGQTEWQKIQDCVKEVKEYRRTCKSCGKVWHSLAEREARIESDIKNSTCDVCMCDAAALTQAKRNWQAQQTEVSRIRTCPQCQSAIYDEEIITHLLPISR